MLNWDFVKADPITYRATHGAIRFEVTVERTIARLRSRLRVRRAISSKSKHFGITGKPCGGVKNIRGSTNPFLVFSVYDQPSRSARATQNSTRMCECFCGFTLLILSEIFSGLP